MLYARKEDAVNATSSSSVDVSDSYPASGRQVAKRSCLSNSFKTDTNSIT